jgi:hypothetical protein
MNKKIEDQKIFAKKQIENFEFRIHNSKCSIWNIDPFHPGLIATCDRIDTTKSWIRCKEEIEVYSQFFMDGYPEELYGYRTYR